MTWKRLRESEIKDSGHMSPARLVLDYDEAAGTYRTFLETFERDGMVGFQYGRLFGTEEEAAEDFEVRTGRL